MQLLLAMAHADKIDSDELKADRANALSWTCLNVVTGLAGGFSPSCLEVDVDIRHVRDSLGAAARVQVGDQAEADGGKPDGYDPFIARRDSRQHVR